MSFMMALLAALPAPDRAMLAAQCEIGALAISDLSLIGREPRTEAFYGDRDTDYHKDVVNLCPGLRAKLPGWLKMATDVEYRRVHDITSSTPVSIYGIGVPVLSLDLHHATVRLGFSCNGLCGAEWEISYVLVESHWRRDSTPRIIAVS